MGLLTDRRGFPIVIGGAVALIAGLGLAYGLSRKDPDEVTPPPPASKGGLVIDRVGQGAEGRLDPAKPLRCFVAGQYVGELTLADCAQRNGVATGALDVGVDTTGQLAAADQAGTTLTPLPPPGPAAAPQPAATPAAAPTGACWRYSGGEWRRLPSDLALNACVQTLYAGRCERPGGATYGRWAQQTLRLVPGKVEISSDNRSFRTLAEQGAGCALPPA
jgi:hypothetical protein